MVDRLPELLKGVSFKVGRRYAFEDIGGRGGGGGRGSNIVFDLSSTFAIGGDPYAFKSLRVLELLKGIDLT